MDRYENSGFGKRDLNSKDHWLPLDVKTYKIVKPTIICLGGNGTTSDNIRSGAQKVNAFCRTFESLVGLKLDNPDIYGSYNYVDVVGFHYGRDREDQTAGYFSKNEVEEIVEGILLPLFVDDKGERLSLETSCDNASLVRFFTHCHGSREINNIMSLLNDKLLLKGFNKEEISEIFECFFQLAYSPMPDETWVPTVRVESLTDSFNYGLYRLFKDIYGHYLDGVEIYYDKAGSFRRRTTASARKDIISIYTSRLVNNEENTDMSRIKDEHEILYLERDINWNIKIDAKNADVVSQLAGYAIARKIMHPKMSLTQLNEELCEILSAFNKEDLKIKRPRR